MRSAIAAGFFAILINACGQAYRSDDGTSDGGVRSNSNNNNDAGASTPAPDGSSPAPLPDSGKGIGCGGEMDCARFVFLTSKAYNANLDGPEGADQRCQVLAEATTGPLHGRTFRAWLGSQSSPTNTRHPHGTKPYRLPDGKIIANSWTDLLDGSLLSAINVTEQGTSSPTTNVWTATNPAGEIMSQTCDDWDSTGGTGGAFGSSAATDGKWTAAGGVMGCASSLPLYCFEY